MLAKARRTAGHLTVDVPTTRELDRIARRPEWLAGLALDLNDHVAGLQLRVIEQLVDGIDRRARHALLIEQIHPMLNRLLHQDPFHLDHQFRTIPAAHVVAEKTRIEGQPRRTDGIGHQQKQGVVAGRDDELAILRIEAFKRRQRRMAIAGAMRHLALDIEARQRRFHQRRLAVEHADIHPRALGIPGAAIERCENAHRGKQRRAQVTKAGPHAGGLTVRPTGQAHDAAHGLHDHVVAGQFAEGAGVPEARDRGIDQVRMRSGQALRAIAQAVHHPGAEVLHQHIRLIQQALKQLAVTRRLDVQHDAFLVAVEAAEIGAFSLHEGTEFAGIVSGPDLLHLDDTCAQVSQHHGAIRPGEYP